MQMNSILATLVCLGCLWLSPAVYLAVFADKPTVSTVDSGAVSKGVSRDMLYPWVLFGVDTQQLEQLQSIQDEIQLQLNQAASAYRDGDYKKAIQIALQTPEKSQQYYEKLSKEMKHLCPAISKESGNDSNSAWFDYHFTEIIEFLADSYFLSGDYDKAEPLYGQALLRLSGEHSGKNNFTLATQAVTTGDLLHTYDQLVQTDLREYLKNVPTAASQFKFAANYSSSRIAEATEDLHNIAIIYDLKKQFADADKFYDAILPHLKRQISQHVIGNLLLERPSQMQQMETQYKQIISQLEKRLGPDNLNVATRLDLLAQWYLNGHDQKRAEAIATLTKAVAIKEKSLGADSPKLVADIQKLVDLSVGNRSNDVNIWTKQLLAIKEKADAADPDLLVLLQRCAQNASASGNRVEANEWYQKLLALEEKQKGKDSPELIRTLKQLSHNYESQGELAEGEKLYKRIITLEKKANMPEKSEELVRDMNALASILAKEGIFAEEELTLKEALKLQEGLNGNIQLTNILLDQLSSLAKRRGDLPEAEQFLKKAIANCQETCGPYSAETQAQMNMLISLLRNQGQYASLEPLLQWKIDCAEHIYGVDSQSLVSAWDELTNCYQQQGKYSDAENSTRKALAVLQRSELKSPSWLCINHMFTLASILALEKKIEAAIEIYKSALTISEQRFELRNQIPRVLIHLARLYRQQGKIKEAEALESRLAAILKESSYPSKESLPEQLTIPF